MKGKIEKKIDEDKKETSLSSTLDAQAKRG